MEGKDKIQNANRSIRAAYDDALKAIIEVVKANGGLIKTLPSSDKPTIYAYYDAFDGTEYHQAIHGLRWDDELGLTLCTDAMLENYQFDNDYCFEYFFDFDGEDAVQIEKVLNDPAYFVEMDKYELIRNETISSIIGGLEYYL